MNNPYMQSKVVASGGAGAAPTFDTMFDAAAQSAIAKPSYGVGAPVHASVAARAIDHSGMAESRQFGFSDDFGAEISTARLGRDRRREAVRMQAIEAAVSGKTFLAAGSSAAPEAKKYGQVRYR